MKLIAQNGTVYTKKGKYMFSVSITDKAKELSNNKGWKKGEESWLDYRKRTDNEREAEQQKRCKFAEDIVNAYNKEL